MRLARRRRARGPESMTANDRQRHERPAAPRVDQIGDDATRPLDVHIRDARSTGRTARRRARRARRIRPGVREVPGPVDDGPRGRRWSSRVFPLIVLRRSRRTRRPCHAPTTPTRPASARPASLQSIHGDRASTLKYLRKLLRRIEPSPAKAGVKPAITPAGARSEAASRRRRASRLGPPTSLWRPGDPVEAVVSRVVRRRPTGDTALVSSGRSSADRRWRPADRSRSRSAHPAWVTEPPFRWRPARWPSRTQRQRQRR